MATETDRQRWACIGVAESITAKLADMPRDRWTAEEYLDLYRTLRDVEDRLYQQGEYAPANVRRVAGGAR